MHVNTLLYHLFHGFYNEDILFSNYKPDIIDEKFNKLMDLSKLENLKLYLKIIVLTLKYKEHYK
jgi:hypothetical protein